MAIPFDCTYINTNSVPALRLSLRYSSGLGITIETVPCPAAPDPRLALLGRGGLHATCQYGQLTGHDLSPCPDPACPSDSL